MKKYTHPLTKELTPENWKEKIKLDSLSLTEVADICADLNSMEKFANKVAGFLKEYLKAHMEDDELDTEYWHLARSKRERAGGLDRDAILEEMGEEWVIDHSKEPTEYIELRITRRTEDEK